MVVSAVYFMDAKGKILISKNYRGDVSRTAAEKFSTIMMETDPLDLKPIFNDRGINYVYVQHQNIYVLALTKSNSNVMTILVFLQKLADILIDYFGRLDEESIRDNFVLIYELLDEVIDHGYPQIAEANVLKEYITMNANKAEIIKPPQAVTNQISWRTEGIRYKKNEVFMDVIEKLNLIMSASGSVISTEIIGSVKMKCQLTGMPEVKLGLNDKALFDIQGQSNGRAAKKSVELEDIKFHQCVRLTRFENDRTISFIPPDGDFELMSYRLSTAVKPLILVDTVVETHGRSRVSYQVKAKSQFKSKSTAQNVDILVPVPPDVDCPRFQTTLGVVKYVPDLGCIMWSIKSFPGGREAVMRAEFGLPSVMGDEREAMAWRKRSIAVKFHIPYYTVSGIQVRYLKVLAKEGYEALPWVRYVTDSGDYSIRMS